LDVDNSKSVSRNEMEKGLLALLKTKIDPINYNNIFNNDNYAKGGELNFPQFVVIIARNKLLENTEIPFKNLSESVTPKK